MYFLFDNFSENHELCRVYIWNKCNRHQVRKQRKQTQIRAIMLAVSNSRPFGFENNLILCVLRQFKSIAPWPPSSLLLTEIENVHRHWTHLKGCFTLLESQRSIFCYKLCSGRQKLFSEDAAIKFELCSTIPIIALPSHHIFIIFPFIVQKISPNYFKKF